MAYTQEEQAALSIYESKALAQVNELVEWAVQNSNQTQADAQAAVAALLRTLVAESQAQDEETEVWQQAYLNVAASLDADPDADDLPHNRLDGPEDDWLESEYESRFEIDFD